MPGKNYNALFEIATEQYGYVTVKDAAALGIPAKRVNEMADHGTLARIGHGVYRFVAFPPSPLDQMMEATLWPRPGRGVLSHETALDLHGLCDVNPAKVHITVPNRQRSNRKVPKLYVLHRRDLEESEKMLHEGIPIVTPARAILDGIEVHLRGDLLDQAIDTAQRRGLLRPAELTAVEQAHRSTARQELVR